MKKLLQRAMRMRKMCDYYLTHGESGYACKNCLTPIAVSFVTVTGSLPNCPVCYLPLELVEIKMEDEKLSSGINLKPLTPEN